MSDGPIQFSDEVRLARQQVLPIVALESTVISYGLPWPANLDTAIEIEEQVRQAGAVPATIAVIDGQVYVGLTAQQRERMARADGVAKASPRDLPWLAAQRRCGATTVAGTIFIAHRAGISIMATGGIGGVHRGASETGDISADLVELSRTPVMVICSGIKSMLDLPRTLEFLETHGVAVVGYGTQELPAFFAQSSGLGLDCRVDTPDQAAALIRQARALGLASGIVLANPPPDESALPREEVERAITAAIEAAESARIRGKAVTPFLLAFVRESIGKRALDANRALVVRNAQLAAQIACALK